MWTKHVYIIVETTTRERVGIVFLIEKALVRKEKQIHVKRLRQYKYTVTRR